MRFIYYKITTSDVFYCSPTKVGHVDFYPNDGKAPQPGCFGEPLGLDCSHQRANVRKL